MAVVGDRPADLRHRWPVPDQAADDALRAVLEQIASASTRRGGRLLAPFGIRSIVVPVVDGATSTAGAPLPVPSGLVDALGAQLDLARGRTPPSVIRFDNTAAIPTTAVLSGPLAEASAAPDPEVVVAIDTTTATPLFVGADDTRLAAAEVPAGTVHLGTAGTGWELSVGGTDVAARPSFGAATAFDVPTAGPGELRFAQPTSRSVWLFIEGALWVLVAIAASRLSVPQRWRPRRVRGETLIDLDAEPGAALPDDRTGFVGFGVGR